jgi:hypothetical protein
MVYDGLAGACARHHGLTLVTCDHRAEETYRLLAVHYHLLQKADLLQKAQAPAPRAAGDEPG